MANISDVPITLSESASEQQHSYYGTTNRSDVEEQEHEERKTGLPTCILKHLTILFGLCIGTYVGVSARIYLPFFSNFDGIQYFQTVWAQVIGTVIIGGLVANKEKIQQSYGVLYISLSTGLCGSLTTFSSWNAEAAKVLLQLNETSLKPIKHPLYVSHVVAFITVLLLGIGMSVAAFQFGKHLASLITFRPCYKLRWQCHLISVCQKRYFLIFLMYLIVYIAITSIILTVCLYTENYEVLFSLLFGCPGTYIRWCLSFFDKRTGKYFPVGTFLANSIGSFILAGTLVAIGYLSVETDIGNLEMAALTGIATGFCGSLTTVSTFVSQICILPFHKAVIYTVTSLFVAQILFTSILAAYAWIKF